MHIKNNGIVLLHLLIIGSTYSHESKKNKLPLESVLTKEEQRQFREDLAMYRGIYVLHRCSLKVSRREEIAETAVLTQQEKIIARYRILYESDPYVASKLRNLEKFKTEGIDRLFQEIQNKEPDTCTPESPQTYKFDSLMKPQSN